MAFIVEKDCKPIIADKDVICYKALFKLKNNKHHSIMNFDYELGKLYFISSKDFKRGHKRNYEITKGFHSFINIPNPNDYNQHSAGYYGDVLLECVIPKGAAYFLNNIENHCISNSIILVKEIKDIIIKSPRW